MHGNITWQDKTSESENYLSHNGLWEPQLFMKIVSIHLGQVHTNVSGFKTLNGQKNRFIQSAFLLSSTSFLTETCLRYVKSCIKCKQLLINHIVDNITNNLDSVAINKVMPTLDCLD